MKKSRKNNINTFGDVYIRGMHNNGMEAMNCCVAPDRADYFTESGTMPGRAVQHGTSGIMSGYTVYSRASGIRPSQDTLPHEVGISAWMYAELKKYEEEKEAEREWAEIKRKPAIVGLFSFGAVLAVIVVFGMRYWI